MKVDEIPNFEAFINLLNFEYENNKARFENFAISLRQQIYKLLEQASITPAVPIQTRIKTQRSIREKIKRNIREYKSNTKLSDIYDLIGIRIILSFERDVKQACQILEETFSIEYKEDKSKILTPEQFGYRSHHLVIKLPKDGLEVSTSSEFSDLKCEIQVRTVAQHLWANASHILQYKSESFVPTPLRRSIHRISALLELIDLEFERVLEDRNEYISKFDQNTPQEINVDSLRKFLQDYLPPNRYDFFERDYDYLCQQLFDCEIKSIDKAKQLIDRTREAVLQEEKRLGDYFEVNEPSIRLFSDPWEAAKFSRVDWVLYALKISGLKPDLLI